MIVVCVGVGVEYHIGSFVKWCGTFGFSMRMMHFHDDTNISSMLDFGPYRRSTAMTTEPSKKSPQLQSSRLNQSFQKSTRRTEHL